jgi:uncharacterized protein (DUF934 family)
MPTLIERGAIRQAPLPDLVPATEWRGIGVPLLAADAEIEARVLEAPAIAIDFPVFSDGRGLSLAVLLRSRHHYTGVLIAAGDVHEDLLHYMRRCGFDSFVLPDERDPAAALAALAPYSDYYQGSIEEPSPAFRRVGRGA